MKNKVETSIFYLRELAEEDVTGAYCSWLNDDEVNAWLITKSATDESLRQFVKGCLVDDATVLWGIFLKDNDQHVGNIKLDHINREKRTATVGILIGEKKLWGRGFGPEVLKAVSRYAFETMGLKGLNLGCNPRHVAAIRCYQKSGFVIDQNQFIPGTNESTVKMVLTRKRFNAFEKAGV